MATVVSLEARERATQPAVGAATPTRLALLGLGQVGSAVARLAPAVSPQLERSLHITGALVRDVLRRRACDVTVTNDARSLLDDRPDVVVEALGGLEPARSLALDAIERGIPVVTANKSVVAAHGDELLDAAARRGVPFRYEASVIAGVPFLCTFARRPIAAGVTQIAGIVNGTSHFVLSRIQTGSTYADALAEAQRRGFAEPDPSKDIEGGDAAEKLAILLRHFGRLRVRPSDIETSGIGSITPADLTQAAVFGATIKPVAFADWTGSHTPAAFVGPALVPAGHPLAGLRGVTNGICLRGPVCGTLVFSGPGAGPEVTAATLLDDVVEALADRCEPREFEIATSCRPEAPRGLGWFVRLRSAGRLPEAVDVADLLASHDVWCSRTSSTTTADGCESRWLQTHPCSEGRATAALDALRIGASCDLWRIPVLETIDAE
jgi:homoserine dehydrogenase